VFYNLGKERVFTLSSPDHRMSMAYAAVSIVAEWTEETLANQPKTRKKIMGVLFGAAKITREFEEDNTRLVEIGLRIPASYEGIASEASPQTDESCRMPCT
jgi:hypothetical protein